MRGIKSAIPGTLKSPSYLLVNLLIRCTISENKKLEIETRLVNE